MLPTLPPFATANITRRHLPPRRGVGRSLCAALLAACVLSVPLASHAQPTYDEPSADAKAEAGTRFKRGTELFNEGDFRAALIEFSRAYELAPNWRVLFNIGQVRYQLQDYPGALKSLQQYLDEGGKDVAADRRATIEADIKRLKPRVSYLTVSVDQPGAEIRIDDVAVGIAPLSENVAVSAGRRKISVSKTGYRSITKMVDLAGGDTLPVDLQLEPQQGTTPTPAPTQPGGSQSGQDSPNPGPVVDDDEGGVPIAPWLVAGGFTVGAAVFGALTLVEVGEVSDLQGQLTTREALDDAESRALTYGVVTDVFIAGAVISGVVAIYMTVDSDSDEEGDANSSPSAADRSRQNSGWQPVRLGLGLNGASLATNF